jgi:hypothetical protein
MYYGYADASATDQSNENGVFGGLGEAAVWSLSQGDSTSADFYTNSVVNDHHGTLTDSDGNVTSSTGYLGGGIDFSGDSGDVISMGTSLDTNYPFTMLTWIQPQSAAGFKTIFSKRDAPEAASARWEIALNPTSNAVYIYTGTGGQTNATLAPATNVWTHVGLKSSDTSSWELFGNGAFQENLGAQTIGSGSGATVRIGATNTDNSNNMNGQVDDLRLYARNLDPMDILTIYNNTVDSTTFWTFGDEETEVGGEAPAREIRLRGGVRFIGGTRLLGF